MTTIDFDSIERAIADGYINRRAHPTCPFVIYNYSQKAQFEWHWTPETKLCRGLICDVHNNVMARPFEKFFSYEQLAGDVPDEPFVAYDKMDGSLGILYWIGDNPHIATRGSFDSPQAIHATKVLQERYGDIQLDRSKTYLFEIIFPDNRVVVDYGQMDDIVLIAIIDTETGLDCPLEDIGFPVVDTVPKKSLADVLSTQLSHLEGFVLRFESGQRVKFKFDEYKRLHKLLTGIGEKHVWDILRTTGDLSELIERVPDEFFQWVRETENDLRGAFAHIESTARGEMRFVGSRKELAAQFKAARYPAVMFAMLDGKDYSQMIWQQIKPKGNTVFKCEGLG